MPPTPGRLALVTDARFAQHVPPGFHPERPERLAAALRGFDRALAATGAERTVIAPAPAIREQLERVHTDRHLALLERAFASGEGWIDPDTYFSEGSRDAALLAAGGACALVDALMDGRADVGALIARPPGHHATRDRPMGFCLLNNVAVAAAHALARGAGRVAVVDWDVHHGNGTQDAFEREPGVLFVSLHQWPLYPGTGAADEVGEGDAKGSTVNVPLPASTDGAGYRAAFERLVLPVVEAAKPDLVLVSAGFDAHRSDPIAAMALEDRDFGWMGARLGELARALGHGRLGLVLEGGYDLGALEQSLAAALVGALGRGPDAPRAGSPSAEAERAIQRAIAAQRPYWSRGVL